MEKQIISVLNSLAENGSEETRRQCSICLSKLTMQKALDSVLAQAGVLLSLQSLLNNSGAHDIISYAILRYALFRIRLLWLYNLANMSSLCNIAPAMTGGDAEAVIRLCLQGCKRLDFLHSYDAALFISKIFCNLSRIPHYVSLLVEEGVLPIMLSLMECQPHIYVMSAIVEALFNMSMLRKNRRDIQSSGISSQLSRILDADSEECRAHAMLMVGNLLAAGYFQDKVSKEDMLWRLIGLLDPNCPVQCYAAAYCVAHLSQSESCSTTMVTKCDMLPIAIKLLSMSLESSTSAYLWTAMANFTCFNGLLESIMENPKFIPLICDDSKTADHQEVVAQLMLNLSQHTMLYTQLDQTLFTKLITAYKLLFIRGSTASVRLLAISMLTNVALSVPESRGFLLGGDLIDIIEESGLTNTATNVRYLTLIYLISKEPQLCPKLVDFGAQRLLMTILPTVATNESAKDTIAATLHNLSLKRALLGTGVLESLLAFAKNCKTIRVLWCARTLANISSYPRSRATLSKEKRVIPFLSAIMRYGCVEADRVQHYCALAICNVLSSHVDKDILQGLVRSGAVVDLVVVTLLRVNSITTKEALGRALFNLLSLADYREELVIQLDVLEALLELGRIERIEMLELSVKAIFNITCETPTYAAKLAELKLPHLMVSRSIAAPELQGAIPTTAVKLSCGQSIANMSFDRKLAQMMTSEKMSESCVAIVNIDTDEARYCACATLYNLSFLDSCISLANSQVVPLLVSMLTSGPVLCIQLAVGALCNFSLFEVFHDQLTALAIGPAINAINAPHLDSNIKLDCLYIIYNVITCFAPCQARAIDEGVVSALLKIIKTNDSEEIVSVVSRIVKEICTMVSMARKLLTDGIMNIMLKLSKFEIPLVKLDLSVAIFNLSMTVEFSLKMLKLDTVDILFWLTIYDCLNLYDPIRKNVVRCLRNFTISAEDCSYICKEERLTSVLKALIKSTSEDVLYNTAVVIYNLLNCSASVVADCRATLLRRGVIQLIFDLAASGYMSVRHICSASLHSVADHIPESDDPAVLQLIMCLLDADGDQFSQLGEKVGTLLPYTQTAAFRGTRFDHTGATFTANWLPLASDVDNIFKAAQLDFDVVSSGQVEVTPLNPTIVTVQAPQKFTGLDFGEFRDSSRPATADEPSADDWDTTPEQLPTEAAPAPAPKAPESARPPIKSLGSRTSSWLDSDVCI